MGSGMGDGSGSEEGDVRGTQGDHDTGHVGTGGGGGSSSRVGTGAVRGTLAEPAGTRRSGAGVSCRTPRTPGQPTRCRSWCGCYGAPSRSEGPGGSGWSGGGGRMPTPSRGGREQAGAGAGGSPTT